jgi:hypothetical protein
MSLAVYVGHAVSDAETAVLWELQANSAAHGIRVFLATYRPVATMTSSRQAEIKRCDAFLGIVTKPSSFVEAEAAEAKRLGKPVFIYRVPNVEFKAPAGAIEILLTDKTGAATLLADVARKLKGAKLPASTGDDAAKALLTVIGIGALLFLLARLARD